MNELEGVGNEDMAIREWEKEEELRQERSRGPGEPFSSIPNTTMIQAHKPEVKTTQAHKPEVKTI